ncbi:MAG: hypothetical protein ACJA1I_000260 [Zhongshania marina]|jgi:hypothetical protein
MCSFASSGYIIVVSTTDLLREKYQPSLRHFETFTKPKAVNKNARSNT